jgi:hypothetical protein
LDIKNYDVSKIFLDKAKELAGEKYSYDITEIEYILRDYFNKRRDVISKCYNKYEDFIDEETSEIVSIGIEKYGLDDDKLDLLIKPIDIEFRNFIVGKYLMYQSENKMRTIFYQVEDMSAKSNVFGVDFKINKLNRNFNKKYASVKCLDRFYSIVDKNYIIKETGWREKSGSQYCNKNLYIFKNEIGRVKIGISENIEERRKSIQAVSGMNIEVLRIINFNANLERQLHKHFANKRYIGEWFDLEENDNL